MGFTTGIGVFPWAPFRAVPAIAAGYVMGYNVLHNVHHSQWWFPFGAVLFALITHFIADTYDEELKGGLLGPMTRDNIAWLMITIGLPMTALVIGIIHGSVLWIIGGAVVLVFNLFLHVVLREQGLPGLLVVVCFLVLAVT